MAPLTWRSMHIGGTRTRVADVRVGGQTRIMLAFVHGYACTPTRVHRRALERLLDSTELQRLGVRLIAPTLPGFSGAAPLPTTTFSLEDYAQWYDQFLDAMDVDTPLLLFGESMGGAIAALVAARRTETPAALAVINSAGGQVPGRRQAQWLWGVAKLALPQRRAFGQWIDCATDALGSLRHLRVMTRLARLVMDADLQDPLAAVAQRSIPSVAVFSRRDPIVLATSSAAFASGLGIRPLFIEGDHRTFLQGHPGIVAVLEVLATSIVEGPPLDGNPQERVSAAVRQQVGLLSDNAMFARTWGTSRPGAVSVVCVHGLVVSSRYFEPLGNALGRTRRVLAPDLPGFGKTYAGHVLDTRELGDALASFVMSVDGPVVLVAQSYGAQVAAAALAHGLANVKDVVFIGPTVDPRKKRLLPLSMARLRSGWWDRTSELPMAMRDLADCGLVRAWRTLQHLLHDDIELATSAPTLVLRGEHDHVASASWCDIVAKRSNGEARTIREAGHDVHAKAPEAVAGHVEAFITALGALPS